MRLQSLGLDDCVRFGGIIWVYFHDLSIRIYDPLVLYNTHHFIKALSAAQDLVDYLEKFDTLDERIKELNPPQKPHWLETR